MKIHDIKIGLSLLLLMTITVKCTDVLDKTNLGIITDEATYSDPILATAALDLIYRISTPGWSINASARSDDSRGPSNFFYGRIQDNSNNLYSGTYSTIRRINQVIEGVEGSEFDTEDKNLLTGQALFFRALHLWNLVRTYGGVPIVTEALNPDDDLQKPRNSTTECLTQIVADLDQAASLLPSTYDAQNFGRITKGTALAVKGRILLHYASEHFDPDQSRNRWPAAYSALSEAKAELDAQGKGLHSSFSELWFDDSSNNPEIVWVRLYNESNTHSRDARVRKFEPGLGSERYDNATIALLESFPMKDGKKISDSESKYTYNPTTFWVDRDPRFETTFAWNGSYYPITHPEPTDTSDYIWTFQGNSTTSEGDNWVTWSGLLNRKAVETTSDVFEARESTTAWIEMRYAEVLLSLAEAANETNRGSEALGYLIDIRQRAGIEDTDGRYGLEAGLEGDKDRLRDAILNERRIELAFEAKRSLDLIRRRHIEKLNGTQRQGYYITKTEAFDALNPSDMLIDDRKTLEQSVLTGEIDLNDPEQYETYFITETYSLEEGSVKPGDEGIDINFDEKYYFFDIPESVRLRNKNLQNTLGWPGGTFDPLQ